MWLLARSYRPHRSVNRSINLQANSAEPAWGNWVDFAWSGRAVLMLIKQTSEPWRTITSSRGMVKGTTITVHKATGLSKADKEAQRQPPSVTVFQLPHNSLLTFWKLVKCCYLYAGNPSGNQIFLLFSLWAHICCGLSALHDVCTSVNKSLERKFSPKIREKF